MVARRGAVVTRPAVDVAAVSERVAELARTLPEHAGGYEAWPISALLADMDAQGEAMRRAVLDGEPSGVRTAAQRIAAYALTLAARVQS